MRQGSDTGRIWKHDEILQIMEMHVT